MHQRTALDSREHSLVKVEFLSDLSTAHDHTASWASQSLMCSGSGHMCVRNGTWMYACSNQTGNMSDIYHQVSTCLIGNLPEFFKVNNPAVGAGTGYDQLGFGLQCNFADFLVINYTFIIYSVRHNIEIRAGEVCRASV